MSTRIDDVDGIYTMNVGGWVAAQLLKHGCIQEQGHGKNNDGKIVPVELTTMDLHAPCPLT